MMLSDDIAVMKLYMEDRARQKPEPAPPLTEQEKLRLTVKGYTIFDNPFDSSKFWVCEYYNNEYHLYAIKSILEVAQEVADIIGGVVI